MPERDGIEISDAALDAALAAVMDVRDASPRLLNDADSYDVTMACLRVGAPLVVAAELEHLADCIRAEAADPGNGWLSNETYRAGKIHAALKARAAALRSASSPTQESDRDG